MTRVRVAYLTNVIPHYREAFFRELIARPELAVTVYCQRSIPGMNLTTVHGRLPDQVRLVRAVSLPRERLAWQSLPWRELLAKHDVFFVQGNPRVVSNVLFASVARLMGRFVVLCGQAHTAGSGGISEWLRLLWWRCFAGLFVYTESEADWLRARGFRRQYIVGMNNGLDQRSIDAAAGAWGPERLRTWQSQQGVADRPVVLSCARLEPKNDFASWLAAMPEVLRRYPDLLWCVIGDGREREALRGRAIELGIDSAIRWLGSITEEGMLAPWFLSSQALVHPSGIGLTLLHAFGYGLPVITNDDATAQMPEYAAFVANETGLSFRYGKEGDLARAVCQCMAEPGERARMSANARRIARENYNTSIMCERLVSVALHFAGRGPPIRRCS